jgi:RNA polymerase sigma factor (sigma-70 family)
LTDIQLIKACLQQDQSSQKLLFDRHSGQMYSICLRYCRTAPEAQDALLIGFTKVFKSLDSYKLEGPLAAWIRRIIVRTCIDLLRAKKSFNVIPIDSIGTMDPGIEYHEQMTYDEMMKVVHQMPEGYRLVFSMFVLDDMSHAEISQSLGIAESTSRTQLVKARKYLQSKIVNKLNQYL